MSSFSLKSSTKRCLPLQWTLGKISSPPLKSSCSRENSITSSSSRIKPLCRELQAAPQMLNWCYRLNWRETIKFSSSTVNQERSKLTAWEISDPTRSDLWSPAKVSAPECLMWDLAFKLQSMLVMYAALKSIRLWTQENSLLRLNAQAEDAWLITLRVS